MMDAFKLALGAFAFAGILLLILSLSVILGG